MKIQVKIILFLLFIPLLSFGQMDEYNYQQELSGITDTWHSIPLSNDIFNQLESGSNDVRVYGITADNDTIEAPYLFQVGEARMNIKTEAFKLLNASKNNKGHYFTYQILNKNPINQIRLDFEEDNFDWKIKLEGTQNQKEWFTIVDDYRILSIKNQQTDYQFTDISFPNSQYQYFRILIKTNKKPHIKNASIRLNKAQTGEYRDCPIVKKEIKIDKEKKQTIIDLDFGKRIPVSHLNINIEDKNDYYRNIKIQYLVDSTENQNGTKYHYSHLSSGTLHSVSPNEFTFQSTFTAKMRVIIDNNDNEPLAIGNISAKDYVYELITRFSKPATYYLAYGNKNINRPRYDVEQFRDKLPENINDVTFGELKNNTKKDDTKQEALFEDPAWLWGIMILIILVLGGFTISMMRKR